MTRSCSKCGRLVQCKNISNVVTQLAMKPPPTPRQAHEFYNLYISEMSEDGREACDILEKFLEGKQQKPFVRQDLPVNTTGMQAAHVLGDLNNYTKLFYETNVLYRVIHGPPGHEKGPEDNSGKQIWEACESLIKNPQFNAKMLRVGVATNTHPSWECIPGKKPSMCSILCCFENGGQKMYAYVHWKNFWRANP